MGVVAPWGCGAPPRSRVGVTETEPERSTTSREPSVERPRSARLRFLRDVSLESRGTHGSQSSGCGCGRLRELVEVVWNWKLGSFSSSSLERERSRVIPSFLSRSHLRTFWCSRQSSALNELTCVAVVSCTSCMITLKPRLTNLVSRSYLALRSSTVISSSRRHLLAAHSRLSSVSLPIMVKGRHRW